MHKFSKIVIVVICVVMSLSCVSAGEVLTGAAAVAKFPATLQGMGIYDAKWSQILQGVEYSFARFTNFYSNVPDDLHVIRVDYANAPVAMKIVNNTPSRKYTSQVAAENNALFSFNGDMERKGTDSDEYPGSPYPYYVDKVEGKIITPGGSKVAGLAFNADRSFDFSGGNSLTFADWENLISCEGTLHNGVNGMSGYSWAQNAPSAGYWLVGMTPGKILYFFVIDGRRTGIAPGINYYNTAELMKEFGCTEGMLFDGGGSTTLVMRDDLVPAADFAWTQHASAHGTGYTTMNYTSANGSTLTERAVVNQLMFVAPQPQEPDYSQGFLEYISTSGNGATGQRINLDYVPNGNTIVRAKFSPRAVGKNQCLYCARVKAEASATAANFNYFALVDNKARFDYYDKQQNTGESMVSGTDYTIEVNRNTAYLKKDDAATWSRTTGLTYKNFTAGGPMTLFQSYTLQGNGTRGNWSNSADIKLYYMRVFEVVDGEEVLKVDLVPRRMNNVVGLYDIVSGRFYVNEGSGSFGAGPDVDSVPVMMVSGIPSALHGSGIAPAYGLYTNIAAGAELAVSASGASRQFSSSMRGSQIGWVLAQGGTTNSRPLSFTYTHNGYAELKANWMVEYKVDISSVNIDNGTVTGGGWYTNGTSATLTAVPAQGQSFSGWIGDIGSADPSSTTITVTADQPRTVIASFGRTMYVSPSGSDSSANPYDVSTPYLTLNKAVSEADDGDTVYLLAGTYDYNGTITVAKPITIAGAGMDKTVLTRTKLTLSHAGAVVSDLKLTKYGSGWSMSINSGATVKRCEISDNTRTSTTGTGVGMSCGSLIDSVVTNNRNGSGGNGVGVIVEAQGDCLIENCQITENTTGGNSGVGGLYITNKNTFNNFNVTVRKTVITGNCGGDAGGISLNGNCNILFEDCVISDNRKYKDATASNTEDAFLGWSNGYTRTLRRCVIQKCPTYNQNYVVEDCFFNVGAGLYDPYCKDYTVSNASPAWTNNAPAFAVSCYAITNRGIERVATPLVARALNASGNVTFEWDLDGDGTFERTGAVVDALFTTPGWHGVTLRANDSSATATSQIEHLVYVAPREIFVWTQSPNPSFPYASWSTASHDPHSGIDAALDGCKVQFTNEAMTVSTPLKVYRRLEVCGTGKDNDSILGNVAGFAVTRKVDSNATGTSIQRTTGDVVNLQLFNTGATVHSFAFGPGRASVVCIYGESVFSNCVVRFGEYTGGNGNGISALAGLITHCVISNNYNYNKDAKGGEVYLSGSAKLRNSLVTGGLHTASTSPGCMGAVYAEGKTEVMNCTIVGNSAGIGAGLYVNSANVKIYNNIVRDNASFCASGADTDWHDASSGADFRNNCMPVAHAGDPAPVTAAPGFLVDENTGLATWTFSTASPCANTGTNQTWMTGAGDLFGNVRLQGDFVDIGCFEADMGQAVCDILAAPDFATGSTNITLRAVVAGKTIAADAQYLWDLDGDGEYDDASGVEITVNMAPGYHTAALKIYEGGSLVFDVRGNNNLVTIYPEVIYFNGTNTVNAAFPFDTPATAAATMGDVLGALTDGAEVLVMDGTHNVESQVILNKKVTLRSVDGLAEKPVLRRTFNGSSFFVIGNPEARVEGLVLDNNRNYSQSVVVNDGTVYDCLLISGYYTSGTGIGLAMNGGLVDRCEISGTRGSQEENISWGSGLAITLGGNAVLRNSLIRRNFCESSTTGRAGGLVYVSDSAIMENCTLTHNTNRCYSIVVSRGSGTVRNCIIADNECGDENRSGSAYWPAIQMFELKNDVYVNSDSGFTYFDYNAMGENANLYSTESVTNSVLGDVRFSDPANGDFSLGVKSPAFHGGLPAAWMESALDYLGNPRLFFGSVDMGAVQSQRGAASIYMVR